MRGTNLLVSRQRPEYNIQKLQKYLILSNLHNKNFKTIFGFQQQARPNLNRHPNTETISALPLQAGALAAR